MKNKKNMRYKRESKPNPEKKKINFKLICILIILVIAIFVRLAPSQANSAINSIMGTTTDYGAMISDIKEVIIRHTRGTRIFSMPIQGEITSPFGKRTDPITNEESEHTGMDIDASSDTDVHSSYKGKVLRAEENEYYGKFIMIEHFDGIVTLYGHLNEILVNIGADVDEKTVIGKSGNTGRSTGPHLHFEVRKDGKCVNPEDYLI